MPTVYEKALPADMPELLDHANYVFSAAHCPHNFRTLLPKVYGEDAPTRRRSSTLPARTARSSPWWPIAR